MYFLEIALLLLGLVMLIAGYRKNNRNMLLAAAMILLLSAGIEGLADGLSQGYSQARDSH